MTSGRAPRAAREHRGLRRAEWVAWVAAAVLGASWLTARGLAWGSEQRSLEAFRAADREASSAVAERPSSPAAPPELPAQLPSAPANVDQREWSTGRIRAYARALGRPAPAPLALLRIPRLGVEVPVLEGTDEWTLDRGLGHIEGTAHPGESGNMGIAGHRDGFFRALENVTEGDLVELALPGQVHRYRVEKLSVVRPEAVHVLRPTPAPRLTLVTCYPFHLVGPAPKRFIVQAVPE